MRRLLLLAALSASVLATACAEPDDAPGTADAGDLADAGGDAAAELPPWPDINAGPTALRRLTHAQYENILVDVFGDDLALPRLAEPDVEVAGLLSVGASSSSFSGRGAESVESAAYAVAEQAMATDERRARVVPCTPSGVVDTTCATQTLDALGLRLWRRPLTADELATVVGLADEAATALGDFYDGLEFGIAALLQSPNFMFRTELGSGDGTFDDYELASRLSFFLWNTAPDIELLDAAAAGELPTDEGLRMHAQRMIDDPRSRRGMRNFFDEWLHLYELDELRKDPTLFEQYSTLLGPDAREETLLFLEHIVFDADADVRDVMTAGETFVNPRLAALYDIPAPVPEGFGWVRLPEDGQRAGLLGHASFLNLHAHQVSTSATRRGAAVRQMLLCQTIPPPPVNVDTSIPEPTGETPTLRDRVAEHLENETCANCHLLFDPIGLGLENFDGIGRWRETDNGAAIDVTGDVDGDAFTNPRELGEAIRRHPDFAPCVVQMLTRYATGRTLVLDEFRALPTATERFAALDYRVRPMLLEIVMSPMFRSAGAPQ